MICWIIPLKCAQFVKENCVYEMRVITVEWLAWKYVSLNDHNDRLFVVYFVTWKPYSQLVKPLIQILSYSPDVNIAQLQIFSVISMQNLYFDFVFYRHNEKTIYPTEKRKKKQYAVAFNCITLHMVICERHRKILIWFRFGS